MTPLLPETNPAFSWILSSTIHASVLILLVLAVRWIFRTRLSPKWCCLLWILVVARMLIPFSWESRLHLPEPLPMLTPPLVFGESPAATEVHSGDPGRRAAVSSETGPGVIKLPEKTRADFLELLFPLWLVGVIFLAGRLVWESLRFARRTLENRPAAGSGLLALLQSSKEEMGVCGKVAVMVSTRISTPMLCGYLRPKLLLPEWMIESFTEAELRYVLLHELGHVKRHDIAVNWVITILQILHWFNPLVWVAFHQMRADREQACDYLVLAHAQNGANIPYGETVLKLLGHFSRQSPLPGLAGILEYKHQMKTRMTMIRNFRRDSGSLVVGAILTAALGALAFTTTPRLHADTAASSDSGKSEGDFFGAWENVDPLSRDYQKILIGKTAGQVYLDCWEKQPGSKGLVAFPRVNIPLSPAELSDKKTFSFNQDAGFVKIDYTATLDGNLLALHQRHTYRDPKRGTGEASAIYVREGQTVSLPPARGLLGAWSNMSEDTRSNRKLEIRGGRDQVFLILENDTIRLPLTPEQAANFGNNSLTVTNTTPTGESVLTLALKDNVLTMKESRTSQTNHWATVEKYLAGK